MVYFNTIASPLSPSKVYANCQPKCKNKSNLSKRRISICTDGTRYCVIDQIAINLEWELVSENELWNINWMDSNFDTKLYHKMKRFQRINHFPGMHEISRKDLLSRNLLRMQKLFPNEYDFFPKTWIFPADIPNAMAYAKNQKNSVFILKPDYGSRGNGIYLTKSLTKINPYKRMICQTYIQKPLLVDRYKFDLRVYTLITSIDPLRIYVYNEGLVRLATNRYSEPNETNIKLEYMHLTNYSINKNSKTYSKDSNAGSKRTFNSLNRILTNDGHDIAKLWSNIDDVIVKTIISALPVLQHSYKVSFPIHDNIPACFEILGFDIIIDAELNPYLLEVNHSPSFNLNETIDKIVKVNLIRDTLNLLQVNCNDKIRILREDRCRILKRSSVIQKERSSDYQSELSDRWIKNVNWEENNIGNYRLIMPSIVRSNKFSKLLANNTKISIYSDTIISKARAEAAKEKRQLRFEKQKMIDGTTTRTKQRRPIKTVSFKKFQTSLRVCKILDKRKKINNGFSCEKIVYKDERNRLEMWDLRMKSISFFQLKHAIFNMFLCQNLLTETDKKMYCVSDTSNGAIIN